MKNSGMNTLYPTHDSVNDSLHTRKTRPCLLVVENDLRWQSC